MAISPAADAQEAVVSSETAISCLTLLSVQIGAHVEGEKAVARQGLGGPTLAISELIELANDFGFRAQYVHRDWTWLYFAVATQPIVLLLKNGNTIVALGVGRTGAAEIVVSDPLHRGGALIILPRESIERAWDGDAVTIVPQPLVIETSETPNAQLSSRVGKTQKFWKLFAVILLCLSSVGAVTVLVTLSITDKSSVSQTKSPLLPTVDPSRISVSAKATGPQDQSRGRPPIAPILSTSVGSIAAEAIPAPTPQPSDREASALAALASVPLLIVEAPAEPNLIDPSAGPEKAIEKGVPIQTASATIGQLAPLAGSDPAHKGSGQPLGPTLSAADVAAKGVPIQTASATIGRLAPLAGSDPAHKGLGQPLGPTLSAADVAALVARGDDQLRLGDVASARLFYEHAADSGEANAALRLGETFDPVFLEHANLRGVNADMEKALFWYTRARDLGSAEAYKLLKDLAQNQSSDR